MDSIALEALSSKPALPAQSGLALDDTRQRAGPLEAQFRDLNLDRGAEADPADTGGEPNIRLLRPAPA